MSLLLFPLGILSKSTITTYFILASWFQTYKPKPASNIITYGFIFPSISAADWVRKRELEVSSFEVVNSLSSLEDQSLVWDFFRSIFVAYLSHEECGFSLPRLTPLSCLVMKVRTLSLTSTNTLLTLSFFFNNHNKITFWFSLWHFIEQLVCP